MSNIRRYVEDHLLDPLKYHPTEIQHTIVELIIEKLEMLYEYIIKFPEIVDPSKDRFDILEVIADQFLFTIRDDADLQEQVDILDNILYVYRNRGSIDTIENMWKYYGGNLPREVKVVVPSYNLFRYSKSAFSGTHVYQDSDTNRPGVYEVILTNNTYPIPDLRDFMLKELVAAGTRIYFKNALHLDITHNNPNSYPYLYKVRKDDLIHSQILTTYNKHLGLTYSGKTPLNRMSRSSFWSGGRLIYLYLSIMSELDPIYLNKYDVSGIDALLLPYIDVLDYKYLQTVRESSTIMIYASLYCTPSSNEFYVHSDLYNRNTGEVIENQYVGYFIVGKTLLGEEIV